MFLFICAPANVPVGGLNHIEFSRQVQPDFIENKIYIFQDKFTLYKHI